MINANSAAVASGTAESMKEFMHRPLHRLKYK